MPTTPRQALDVLRGAAADGRLATICRALDIRLLGVFGSVLDQAVQPNDLDLSVSFSGPSHELELIDRLTVLSDFDRIDLLVLDRAVEGHLRSWLRPRSNPRPMTFAATSRR